MVPSVRRNKEKLNIAGQQREQLCQLLFKTQFVSQAKNYVEVKSFLHTVYMHIKNLSL